MLFSGHVKKVFNSAKNEKNIVCFKCKNDKSFITKKCIVLDIKENQFVEDKGLDVKLYLKDINKNDNDKIEMFVSDINGFIVTNDLYT